MNSMKWWVQVTVVLSIGWVLGGCEKPVESTATTGTSSAADSPNDSGAGSATKAPGPKRDRTLHLTGITMTIPDGWITKAVKPGPMAAKAAFNLPGAGAEAHDGSVRITHYPNMKGMDDANIDRWMKQMTKPDGTAFTRDSVQVATIDMGSVRLKIVDLTGTLRASMGGGAPGLPNHRMIAAVIDHPKGPHFVKVTGEADSMRKWAASVDAFLKSAQAN